MGTATLVIHTTPDREKQCESCGRTFAKDPRNTWAYWERQKYCSRACFGSAHRKRAEETRPPLADVFWSKVIKSEGCWEWDGIRDKDGYGLLPHAGELLRAHVVALELDGRPVPDGMYGCHHCDNAGCVREEHLYVGTPKQNYADAKARGRMRQKRKLSIGAVRAIRFCRNAKADDLAAHFGVTRGTVHHIWKGETWRHVK